MSNTLKKEEIFNDTNEKLEYWEVTEDFGRSEDIIPANDNDEPTPPSDSTGVILPLGDDDKGELSTELVVSGNNNFLAVPTDPKELNTFIAVGTKAIEAAQAILKKSNISGEEFKQLHQKTKEHGFVVLNAALDLAIQIRDIPTEPGKRTDKEHVCDEEGSADETRTKKDVLKEDFGLSEYQAWRISQLTVDAVDKEKAYANKNDEVPTLSHAMSFVEAKKRQAKKAQENSQTFESRNRTDKIVLPGGKFDVIYADVAKLSEDLDIADKVNDSAIIYLLAAPNQLLKALEFMTSLGFEYKDCAVAIKEEINSGCKFFQNKHDQLLVGVKGDYPTPYTFRTPSVCYGYELGDASAEVYFHKAIERMYPEGAYWDLTSEKASSNKWSTCSEEEEA